MEGWEISTLGLTCEVTSGQSPKGEFINNKGEGLPFHQGKKEFQEKYLGPSTKWASQITRVADMGDIVMSVRAPVGPINFVTEQICIGRGLAGIRAGDCLNNEFLFYALLAMQDQITGSEGAVFASINRKQIQNLSIPLPPLPEQERIVAMLDEAFAAIDTAAANTEKNLANAKELFENYVRNVLSNGGDSWVQKKFGDCLQLKSGDGLTKKGMVNGPYPVYGGNGINGTHNQSNLSGENVIIGRVGAHCGNVRYIKEDIWLTDNAFRVLEFETEFNAAFLVNMLNDIDLNKFARQAAQPVISNSSLKDIKLSFPESKSVQRKIADKIKAFSSAFDHSMSIYNSKLDRLVALKQSLLQKAFAGELTADSKVVDRTLSEASV